MAFSVYIRKAVENGKIIFPIKYCASCSDHQNGEELKCLECLKGSKTPHSFSSQYFNDPIDADSVEFKTEWVQKFQFTSEITNQLNRTPAIMSIDPAVGLKGSNDYTGIVVTKVLPDNHIYILEAQQKRMSPPQLIAEVFKLKNMYNARKVLLETTSAQMIFMGAFKQEMVRRKEFFTIEEVGRTTKETKAMRIRSLIPFYSNGMILHRHGLNDLEYQMLQFPRNTHDDILDALAHQVPFWKAGHKASVKTDSAPYMSMNWWKKQYPTQRKDKIQQLFGDLI